MLTPRTRTRAHITIELCREVIRLKLEIARLRKEGVSEETIAKLTTMTETALQEVKTPSLSTVDATVQTDANAATLVTGENEAARLVQKAEKERAAAESAAEAKYVLHTCVILFCLLLDRSKPPTTRSCSKKRVRPIETFAIHSFTHFGRCFVFLLAR